MTSLDGYEMMPSLSPDGNQVAFAWNGDKDGSNVDVYVSMMGTPAVHRLTTHPAMDVFPRWSPDGRQIAFVRQWTDHAGRVYVVSPLGGPERKLSDFDAHFDRVALFGDLSWSPDGRYIAAARSSTQREGESTGIYLIPVEGGEPRLVTPAKAPASDRDPAISHDGRRLAYFSCANCCYGGCDVMTVELDAELRPMGAPRRLTSMNSQMEGLAWTRDGRSLVFRRLTGILYYLWRVDVDGRHPPERIEVTGVGARRPSTVPSRDRLVYGRLYGRHGYLSGWAQGLGARSQPVLVPRFLPHVPPDGTQIAFCSARSGDMSRVWVARADGSEPRQLTGDMQGGQHAPSWSPDGRTLAFESTSDGQYHIWTIDVEGANLRRITSEAGNYHKPTWSRDGASIYFGKAGATRIVSTSKPLSSSRADLSNVNIWRIPVAGGPAEQVTQSGGVKGVETADGKALVYQPGGSERVACSRHSAFRPIAATARSLRLRVLRGDQRRVLLSVPSRRAARGVGQPEADGHSAHRSGHRPRSSGSDAARSFVRRCLLGPAGFARWQHILYTRVVNRGEDLMMIENFR